MSYAFRKRDAIIISIIVIAVLVGFALGYIVGANKPASNDSALSSSDPVANNDIVTSVDPIVSSDTVSQAERPVGPNNEPPVSSDDKNNGKPPAAEENPEDQSETPYEIPADEDPPDDNKHYISWQFSVYEEPDFTSRVVERSPPRIIEIIECREDGWAQIEMSGRFYWAYIEKNLYYLDRSVSLYAGIEGEDPIGELEPQLIEIIDQRENWIKINTDLGFAWTDIISIRQTVRLDVPSYDQRALGYPLGCELVSLAMMMNYKTYVDVRDLYEDLPRADHPDEGFRGDPASSSHGWTIFPPALAGMMEKYIGSYYDMSGLEIEDLKAQINTDTPILVWIRGLGWPVHALCLTGYNRNGFYYNDPYTGEKDTYITYEDFYEIWNNPIYDSVLNITYTPRKAMSYH